MGAPLCAIRGNKVGGQERCPQTWRSRRMVDIAPCATPHVYNATEYPDRGEGYVCAHATGAVSPHIAAINLASIDKAWTYRKKSSTRLIIPPSTSQWGVMRPWAPYSNV